MPKVVTKVRTGGFGFPGEDLRTGSRRSAMSAVERKLTWIAILRRVRDIFQAGERPTRFPAFGRLAAIEGEDPRSQEDVIEALQPPCLLSHFQTACKRHHVDLPDQNVGRGLVQLAELCLDLLLDASAVLDVYENESLDIAMGKDLGGPRAKCAVCAGDEDGPAFV